MSYKFTNERRGTEGKRQVVRVAKNVRLRYQKKRAVCLRRDQMRIWWVNHS